MPIITAIASLPVLASIMWTCMMGVIVARPDSSDLYACLGAGLASICTLIEARGNGRTVAETIRVFIGSAASGIFLPGVLYTALQWKGWLSPEAEKYVVWQWWAAAGFFFALNGWGALHLLNVLLQRRAQRLIDKWLPEDQKGT